MGKNFSNDPVSIVHTNGANADFAELCAELDRNLVQAAIKEIGQSRSERSNTTQTIQDAFVAYADGVAVGCIALKPHGVDLAEVKRMFVRDDFRGKGIAWALLAALEAKAAEKNFSTLILETGRHLETACRLYKKAGFEVTPDFDQYKEIPQSVCMKKKFRAETAAPTGHLDNPPLY